MTVWRWFWEAEQLKYRAGEPTRQKRLGSNLQVVLNQPGAAHAGSAGARLEFTATPV